MTSNEEAEADLSERKQLRDLLGEIYGLARSMTTPGQRDLHMMRVIGKFSAILVRISQTAEKQSEAVIRLTRWLIIFTIALLVIGAAEILRHFCTR